MFRNRTIYRLNCLTEVLTVVGVFLCYPLTWFVTGLAAYGLDAPVFNLSRWVTEKDRLMFIYCCPGPLLIGLVFFLLAWLVAQVKHVGWWKYRAMRKYLSITRIIEELDHGS